MYSFKVITIPYPEFYVVRNEFGNKNNLVEYLDKHFVGNNINNFLSTKVEFRSLDYNNLFLNYAPVKSIALVGYSYFINRLSYYKSVFKNDIIDSKMLFFQCVDFALEDCIRNGYFNENERGEIDDYGKKRIFTRRFCYYEDGRKCTVGFSTRYSTRRSTK